MSAKSRRRAAERTREILAELLLAEVRKLTGKSQSEVAHYLGIKQPSLSKLEGQNDMQISTLQRIIEALGGKVEIVARFPNGAIRLRQFQVPRTGSTHSKTIATSPRQAKLPHKLQLV